MRTLCYITITALLLTLSGQECLAQKEIKRSTTIVKVQGKKMYAHIVKKKETVYSLCKAYGITAEELQEINPIIAEGLKVGQILYIPFIEEDLLSAQIQEPQENCAPQDTLAPSELNPMEEEPLMYSEDSLQNAPSEKESLLQKFYPIYFANQEDSTRTIAMILPLGSGTYNTNYMDFYCGALLAAKDLKSEGRSLKLNVINQNSSARESSLPESEKLLEADVIIGPVRSPQLRGLIEYSTQNAKPIVSPLDPSADSLVASAPYLFQVPNLQDSDTEGIAKIIIADYYNAVGAGEEANIVIITQLGSNDSATGERICQIIDDEKIPYKRISYSVLQGSAMTGEFREKISPLAKNLVAIISNNEAFVSDAVRNTDILGLERDLITLYGTSNWKGFEATDLSLLYKYNLHLAMPYYINLKSESVRRFILEYRALFKTEPSANAFSGYDVLSFFATRPEVVTSEDELTGKYLQQGFDFHRKEEQQGFINTACTLITYNPDYTISVVE